MPQKIYYLCRFLPAITVAYFCDYNLLSIVVMLYIIICLIMHCKLVKVCYSHYRVLYLCIAVEGTSCNERYVYLLYILVHKGDHTYMCRYVLVVVNIFNYKTVVGFVNLFTNLLD